MQGAHLAVFLFIYLSLCEKKKADKRKEPKEN